MTKSDRRIQRTCQLLQKALIELLSERKYEEITIQEIVDRANVGRTTFYLHFDSKDDLFMSCHDAIATGFHSLHSLPPEKLISPEAPPEIVAAYEHLFSVRALLDPIFRGKDSQVIQRQIRDQSASTIEANLRARFSETTGAIPIHLLANYLAGAQIALVQWWLEKHQPYTPEALAQTFHRLQRAAICDAFGLRDM